jgi:biopolymer transport protein ExbB
MEFLKQVIEANGVGFVTAFLTLSLAGVALVVWRLLLNFTSNTKLNPFLERLQAALQSGGPAAAHDLCKSESGLLPKLFIAAIENGPRGKLAARNAIANTIELEIVPALNFLIPWILLITKIAPMVGLLGTVIGMIGAFAKIALPGAKVNPSDLANEIGMALYTTAEGLLIAIPLIFAYQMFKERVHRFEIDIQRGAEIAMDMLPQLTGRQM